MNVIIHALTSPDTDHFVAFLMAYLWVFSLNIFDLLLALMCAWERILPVCISVSWKLPRNTSHQPKLQKGLTQLDLLLRYNTDIWRKHIQHHKRCKDIWICTARNIILILTYCSRRLGKIWILISQKKGTWTCFFLNPKWIQITCINVNSHREGRDRDLPDTFKEQGTWFISSCYHLYNDQHVPDTRVMKRIFPVWRKPQIW